MARISIDISSTVGNITVSRDDHLGRFDLGSERSAIFDQMKSAIETVSAAYGIGMELVAFDGSVTLRNPSRESVSNAEIEDLIREYGHRFINEQNALATADLFEALGDRMDDVEYIQSLGYEVVWQYSPDGPPHEFYRGLLRNGAWAVDHYPDWPQPASMHEGTGDA